MYLLLSGIASLSIAPFADVLEDDLKVTIIKSDTDGNVEFQARTVNNLSVTKPEYGLIQWLLSRLTAINVTPKTKDVFYIRQSLVKPENEYID